MRPFTLRPLTLGVLIVAGGTLSALPFRRYQPAGGDTSAQANGPVTSSLTFAPTDRSPAQAALGPQPSAENFQRSDPAAPPIRPQRSIHTPLTYDDIAVPIDRSKFSATPPDSPAGRRDRSDEPTPAEASGADAIAGVVPPPSVRPKPALPPESDLQPLELSDAPSPHRLAETGSAEGASVLVQTPPTNHSTPRETAETAHTPHQSEEDVRPNREPQPSTSGGSETSSATGHEALASSKLPDSNQPSLVQQPVRGRQRHWIRQPQ